jgi:GH15 family glucan-1,4-alpha-glucosidase
MAWVAFDRAAAYSEALAELSQNAGIADQDHADVFDRGFDRELGSFVQAYGSKWVDASLLLLPLVGLLPATDPRIRGRPQAIEQRPLVNDEFVLRYETEDAVDGLPPGEGAFLVSSFWLADNPILKGRYEEAQRLFNRCSRGAMTLACWPRNSIR